jgi:hypothetical protein
MRAMRASESCSIAPRVPPDRLGLVRTCVLLRAFFVSGVGWFWFWFWAIGSAYDCLVMFLVGWFWLVGWLIGSGWLFLLGYAWLWWVLVGWWAQVFAGMLLVCNFWVWDLPQRGSMIFTNIGHEHGTWTWNNNKTNDRGLTFPGPEARRILRRSDPWNSPSNA